MLRRRRWATRILFTSANTNVYFAMGIRKATRTAFAAVPVMSASTYSGAATAVSCQPSLRGHCSLLPSTVRVVRTTQSFGCRVSSSLMGFPLRDCTQHEAVAAMARASTVRVLVRPPHTACGSSARASECGRAEGSHPSVTDCAHHGCAAAAYSRAESADAK